MRRPLLAVLLVAGCGSMVEQEGGPCDPYEEYCENGIRIEVADEFSDFGAPQDLVLALGGIVGLVVEEGEPRDGEMYIDVTGGAVVSRERRAMVVRPRAESMTVHADIDGVEYDLSFDARPVDLVRVHPMEHQFMKGDPVEFGIVRGVKVPILIKLFGAGQRLIDNSLTVEGPAVFEQWSWDTLYADGAAEPIAFAITADSTAAEVEIPAAEPVLDAIVVATGPELAHPNEPVILSELDEATICFHGMAGGISLAGLEWRFEGDGITTDDGCAMVGPSASSLTVSAGGVTRSYQLDVVER